MTEMQRIRQAAASDANAEDASIWRWLSALLEERRIRWCASHSGWLVSVDHKHVATDNSFDRAIRVAKENSERRALGHPKTTLRRRRVA
ncbi:hypothetical protein [Paraburkholderia sediminicola]|uniref:hypothetical protein n=1 Tax=Paraburkholderia sediminicola TaxID=458836 RepID=UPI000E745958